MSAGGGEVQLSGVWTDGDTCYSGSLWGGSLWGGSLWGGSLWGGSLWGGGTVVGVHSNSV